jgi:hypothetical protein
MASGGLPADWRHPENDRFSEDHFTSMRRPCLPLKMRMNSSGYQLQKNA